MNEAMPMKSAAEHGALKPLYLEALGLVERLHRCLLDVIKDEFERSGLNHLNSVQGLLLFNIGEAAELPTCELRKRGYFLGANISYNLKKLAAQDYVHHTRSPDDRRVALVSLTPKGRSIAGIVEHLYERHVSSLADGKIGLGPDGFQEIGHTLFRLDRFLGDQIRYQL